MPRVWRVIGAVLLAVAAIAFLGGRCSVVPPGGPSRDSLALVAAADSLRAARDTAAAAIARSDSLAAQAGDALAFADSLHRVRRRAPLPPRPDSTTPPESVVPMLWERVDSLESQLAQVTQEAESASASARRCRDAHREAVEAASRLIVQAASAEGRLNQAAVKVGDLEGALRKARNGIRLSLAASAMAAGDGWATLAGPQLVVRRAALGLEAEAGVTAGWGAGGELGKAPSAGPGLQVTLRVGF